MSKIVFILGVVSCLVGHIQSEDVVACQNTAKPGYMQNDEKLSMDYNQPIHVRYPTTGFYTSQITCILIKDLYKGTSIPVVTPGIGFNYVHVDIASGLFTKLYYEIKVYTQIE
ncbi:uncharacterized protein LOC126883225 isoform X1 [Diabrotica virgifera virgifera]|uniref:Salivary secreted peptide n=1 Tax=Diabrotica virgifera virgifera TaxID=50390 RepID=A0ABM5K2P9_DIAVI|nr:uncharacterized protein LOC126883225 isoform X1 [Diabrotica virgifera virgifera]